MRTTHPRLNGWAQICCSSEKKEQILIRSIKQSCSPDSYVMLTARDSVTVWRPAQMCRMLSAAEDKEPAVSAFCYCRYGQTHWPHTTISWYLTFPAFGQTKRIKNEICLSNVLAPSEQRVMISEATHILEGGSHERFSVSSKSRNCRPPPQISSENRSVTTASGNIRLQVSVVYQGKPRGCLVQFSILM